MKQSGSWIKSLLRWMILGGTLFFLGSVFKDNWQQVVSIRVSAVGWACLAIALGITLLAHICAGWIWSQILRDFKQPVQSIWAVQAYLKTNIAKYLPGNVWHYVGRVAAAIRAGAESRAATVSVLLEPLLMAAAALLITLLCSQQILAHYGLLWIILQWLCLLAVLAAVHPKILNLLIQRLSKLKQSTAANSPTSFQLNQYPTWPLIGELSFLILRGVGFLLTFLALSPIATSQLPLLFSTFSLAWLLGLVIPGAPGGLGVFEATAIGLLSQSFSPGLILSVVALYRLISVLAEAMGAGLAWLDEQRS